MTPAWHGTERVLLLGGTIHSPVSPFATAMLLDGPVVGWLGDDAAAQAHLDSADVVVDLAGALVTPGFVDAHVHTTSTGLMITGLDLCGVRSRSELLDRVRAAASGQQGGVLVGHGWDETVWDDQAVPTLMELDRAAHGAAVYLSRVDVHSALVSSAMLHLAPVTQQLDGFDGTAHVSRAAHHAARETALAGIGPTRRLDAQRAARHRAASLGIVALHEMAGPVISSEEDLRSLQDLAEVEPGPLISAYWGELVDDGGVEHARSLGAVGAGGDLFIDGSIGSHTAGLACGYHDLPESTGAVYLTREQVERHVLACMGAGMQAGFHVIGDGAAKTIVEALVAVSVQVGADRMRMAMHRLEHAEMLDDGQLDTLSDLGVTLSMQPMFDALWGAPGGMYEMRLGASRARGLNRFASAGARGILLAFGSDAPVTGLGPWAAMRAAMFHHQPEERITARAAFAAHTRAGWRAVGAHDAGVLAPGAPAHYVIWQAPELVVQTPDERVSGWSTDPRSGTPGLPDLTPDVPLPQALRTVVAGRTVYDSGHVA